MWECMNDRSQELDAKMIDGQGTEVPSGLA